MSAGVPVTLLALCQCSRATFLAETKERLDLPAVVLSDAVLDLVLRRMRLLSDPVRLRALLALQDGELSVQQVADALDVEHCKASRSLSALHREGLLARRQENGQALYSIADYTACPLLGKVAESVTAHIEELHDLVCGED